MLEKESTQNTKNFLFADKEDETRLNPSFKNVLFSRKKKNLTYKLQELDSLRRKMYLFCSIRTFYLEDYFSERGIYSPN